MLFLYIEVLFCFVFIISCKLHQHSAIVGCVITGDVTNLCGNKNFKMQLHYGWMYFVNNTEMKTNLEQCLTQPFAIMCRIHP